MLFAAVVVITLALLWHARAYPLGRGGPGLMDRVRRNGGGARRDHDQERLDALLGKVAEVGLKGLSDKERAELKAIADRRAR